MECTYWPVDEKNEGLSKFCRICARWEGFGGWDGKLKYWAVAHTCRCVQRYAVLTVDFSPAGNFLASGNGCGEDMAILA